MDKEIGDLGMTDARTIELVQQISVLQPTSPAYQGGDAINDVYPLAYNYKNKTSE